MLPFFTVVIFSPMKRKILISTTEQGVMGPIIPLLKASLVVSATLSWLIETRFVVESYLCLMIGSRYCGAVIVSNHITTCKHAA